MVPANVRGFGAFGNAVITAVQPGSAALQCDGFLLRTTSRGVAELHRIPVDLGVPPSSGRSLRELGDANGPAVCVATLGRPTAVLETTCGQSRTPSGD